MRRKYDNYGNIRKYAGPVGNHPFKIMSIKINHFLLGMTCAVAFACLTTGARAAVTTLDFQPNPVDLNDLDHHYSYSWRIDNLNLGKISITSATLTFSNIANGAVIPSLITSSTAMTKLFQKSFTTTPTTYTYTFTATQLAALTTYISNGDDVAFGFDPECHFFNDGITFAMTFTPVPEMASTIPALCLIFLAIAIEIRGRRRAKG
jgi:hypothetical protein